MQWARIQDQKVMEVITTDPMGWAPSEYWFFTPAPDGVVSWGWWYVDGEFTQEDPNETIETVRAAKTYDFRSRCDEFITRFPFTSEALGVVHTYDCRSIDQSNATLRYIVADTSGTSQPLWASDGTRYSWIDHTADQIAQVLFDMNEHIKVAQVKLAGKLAALDAATTKVEAKAVAW